MDFKFQQFSVLNGNLRIKEEKEFEYEENISFLNESLLLAKASSIKVEIDDISIKEEPIQYENKEDKEEQSMDFDTEVEPTMVEKGLKVSLEKDYNYCAVEKFLTPKTESIATEIAEFEMNGMIYDGLNVAGVIDLDQFVVQTSELSEKSPTVSSDNESVKETVETELQISNSVLVDVKLNQRNVNKRTCKRATIQKSKKFKKDEGKEVKSSEKPPFNCSDCDYVGRTTSLFKRHQMSHLTIKKFKCTKCSYSTNFNSYLEEHKVTHSNERPFKCSFCEFASKLKSNLKKHERTHQKFKCPQCKFVTKTFGGTNSCGMCGYTRRMASSYTPIASQIQEEAKSKENIESVKKKEIVEKKQRGKKKKKEKIEKEQQDNNSVDVNDKNVPKSQKTFLKTKKSVKIKNKTINKGKNKVPIDKIKKKVQERVEKNGNKRKHRINTLNKKNINSVRNFFLRISKKNINNVRKKSLRSFDAKNLKMNLNTKNCDEIHSVDGDGFKVVDESGLEAADENNDICGDGFENMDESDSIGDDGFENMDESNGIGGDGLENVDDSDGINGDGLEVVERDESGAPKISKIKYFQVDKINVLNLEHSEAALNTESSESNRFNSIKNTDMDSNSVGSNFSNSNSVGSSLSGSNVVSSSISGSKGVDSSLSGSNNVDSSLPGKKVVDSSLSGSNDQDSSLLSSNGISSSLSGSNDVYSRLCSKRIGSSFSGSKGVSFTVSNSLSQINSREFSLADLSFKTEYDSRVTNDEEESFCSKPDHSITPETKNCAKENVLISSVVDELMCKKCNIAFRFRKMLKVHMDKKHGGVDVNDKSSGEKKFDKSVSLQKRNTGVQIRASYISQISKKKIFS